MRYVMWIAGLLISSQVMALSINTMVLISGKDPKGDFFILKNDSDDPVFVKTEMSVLTVRDNVSSEQAYTRENLGQWAVTTDPSLFILDPGESRQVVVKAMSASDNRLHDEVYGIAFVPQATAPERQKKEQINIQVGFKAYYLVPATNSWMDYDIKYEHQSGKLTLTNRGNTLLLAELDQCKKELAVDVEKPCSTSFLAIAGKVKEYTVPEWLRQRQMVFRVVNHNKQVSNMVTLTPEQPYNKGGTS